MLQYVTVRLLTVLLPFMPFYVTDAAALVIGTMMYNMRNWRIDAVKRNMEKLGIEGINPRDTFINQAIALMEFFRAYYTDFRYIRSITYEPELTEIRKDERFVLLSAHFGCWELAGVYVSKVLGHTFTVAESAGTGMDHYKLYEKLRSVTGMGILRLENKTLAGEIQDLIDRSYRPVLMCDRDFTHTGIKVKMGNGALSMPKGPFFFAKRNSLPMYFGIVNIIKHKKYRYRAVMKKIGICNDMIESAQKAGVELFKVISENPHFWTAYEAFWEE